MKIHLKDLILVSIQFVLFGFYTIDFDWSLGFSYFFKTIGLSFSIIGFLIALLAVLQLNKNISPFPTPKENAVLLENGLFKYVRHPIYTGIIFMLMGYSVYQNSIYKLCITGLLMLLFYIKTDYEENQLIKKFPEYIFYKRKTGKFFVRFF
ncbi:isoprenylcysteine carboxylmethyltransferase family protein [Flavobacterium sp.]|uniref:methyltransferase family protein n=1 Tax=Flavobacterium sp. TaxID=239 RepID=UPI00262A921B|nr:isoprenylcysteine carboxylmethyltransferase family protein [Flavobacterium sp.]MDG2432333.1 isoprenylcysteine carboxylmethyltransferase family protein [Flavobacterium sp.]